MQSTVFSAGLCYTSGSQLGAILLLRGHLAASADIFSCCHNSGIVL